jgi:hypothetical protein
MLTDEECCLVVKHTFLELTANDDTIARRRSWSDSDLLEASGVEDNAVHNSKGATLEEDSDGSTTDADTAPESSSSDEGGDDRSTTSDRQTSCAGFVTIPTVPPCVVAGQSSMMYMVQMPSAGMQMMCPVQPAQPPGLFTQAATLEQQAMSLDAYASRLAAEARRAQVAASAASRKMSIGSQSDIFPNDKDEIDNDDRTTLMFRNLPNNYTRANLLDMLDTEGFSKVYSFVYLPTDFKNFAGFGYAFVNFATHEAALLAKRHFQGYCNWSVPSQKICEVVWSGPVQGLSAHTERYRNSPVMHDSVPDEYKPVVFVNGSRVKFPPPTRKIRPPRVRQGIAVETQAC